MAAVTGAMASMMKHVSISAFSKVMLVVGKATHVAPNPSAKVPAYLLKLDFGQALNDEHTALHRKPCYTSSAQLCTNHTVQDLTDQPLMCVANFPRKQIGKFMSDCLVTGAQARLPSYDARRETTVFMKPSREIALGSRISIFGIPEVVTKNPRDLAWSEFEALDLRIATVTKCAFSESDQPQSTFVEAADNKDNDNKSASGQLALVDMTCDLGDEFGAEVSGVGLIDLEVLSPKDLLAMQVLVLTNLAPDDVAAHFYGSKATAILCTIAGKAFVGPALKVANGYKIA